MRLQNTSLPFSFTLAKPVISSVSKIHELAVSFPNITCTLDIFKNAPLTLQVVSSKQDLLFRGESISRFEILVLEGIVPIMKFVFGLWCIPEKVCVTTVSCLEVVCSRILLIEWLQENVEWSGGGDFLTGKIFLVGIFGGDETMKLSIDEREKEK